MLGLADDESLLSMITLSIQSTDIYINNNFNIYKNDITIIGCYSNNHNNNNNNSSRSSGSTSHDFNSRHLYEDYRVKTHNDSEGDSLILCIPQLDSEYDNFYKIWMKYIKKNVNHTSNYRDHSRSNDDDDDNNDDGSDSNYSYDNNDDHNNIDNDRIKYRRNYERNEEHNEYLSCTIWLNDQKPITKGFKLLTTFICSWEDNSNNVNNKNMIMMKEKLNKKCNLFKQHDNNKDNYYNERKTKTRFSSDSNNNSRRSSDFLPAHSNVLLLGKYELSVVYIITRYLFVF